MAANHRHMSLSSLSRRPVLIAVLAYSAAYGGATFAVWRDADKTSNTQKCERHYLVQGSAESAGRSEPRGLWRYDATRLLLI
jgi:delta-aminolevulinic acid dehydratase/porphobilinogen synthase